jgi:hypothetical protein
MKKEIS